MLWDIYIIVSLTPIVPPVRLLHVCQIWSSWDQAHGQLVTVPVVPNKPFSQNTNNQHLRFSKTFQNQFGLLGGRWEERRDPAGPSRSLVKAWPGAPGLTRPGCSTERELPSLPITWRADFGSFSPLPSAAPGISSRLALIVNSHMINLSAWRVGRIEAPELFPLG